MMNENYGYKHYQFQKSRNTCLGSKQRNTILPRANTSKHECDKTAKLGLELCNEILWEKYVKTEGNNTAARSICINFKSSF